jgi:hypothetical protein
VRRTISVCAVVVFATCSGCVTELNAGARNISESIGPLTRQQVVSNLVQEYLTPYSMPSQSVVNQGVVTVQNTASLTTKFPYTVTKSTDKEIDPGLSLQWSGAWTLNPVMDAQDIQRLVYIYTTAAHPHGLSVPGFTFNSYQGFTTSGTDFGRPLAGCTGGSASGPSSVTVAAAAAVSTAAQTAAMTAGASPQSIAAAAAAVAQATATATSTPAAARAAMRVAEATSSAAARPNASVLSTATAASMAAAAVASETGPIADPLQNCSVMDPFLKSSANWLFFRKKRVGPTAPDNYVFQGSSQGLEVWAEPEYFMQFMLYVLDATPNTQSTSSSKGVSLSIQ